MYVSIWQLNYWQNISKMSLFHILSFYFGAYTYLNSFLT